MSFQVSGNNQQRDADRQHGDAAADVKDAGAAFTLGCVY